ncbi:glycosyltransferase family 2 protein [Pedobacter aquatilis]|uniref:glycosyltransferase family 2 protein n=1 Tax=Pedobacter aquatilis TaxID=351343 RepID=UPI0025B36D0A|nr:glycosyltransferase family 2 protein [Pedobacter aquatilis]MDN3586220.1 glycosyltransferase family 2 protein [Pedobacter aquatilis]
MKISIITVVFNGEAFLDKCIESVINQSYADIEYILIDGASTDTTISIINKYRKKISKLISEPDNGLYHAVNKGINLASGEIIGLLNADDMLADNTVITQIVNLFKEDSELEAAYGDLNYIHPNTLKIIRKWKSKQADKRDLINGWMPAHPTLYVKKSIFKKYGNYALDLGTAADYDLMLRLLYVHSIKAQYLPILMVNMRIGGLSNGSLKGILMAAKNDLTALKRNNLPFPLLALLKKKFAKITQFL